MPKYREDAKMERISIAVPVDTLEEIEASILDVGAYRAYFLQLALILGSRALRGILAAGASGIQVVVSVEPEIIRDNLTHETARRDRRK